MAGGAGARAPIGGPGKAETGLPDADPVAFEGPLALLLSLIEARQLDVLTVPLGALAGAYLAALADLQGDRLPHLSAFVAVAAQLILIKSRALLPRAPAAETPSPGDDLPDPEAELRRRLIVYRAYRQAGAWLLEQGRTCGPLLRREPAVAQAAGVAGARPAPEPPLDPGLLVAALRTAARLAEPPLPPPEVLRRTITLAERAEAIREALRGTPLVVLQDLIGTTPDRVLATVTFLAMLELVKRHEISVTQERPWGPILCRSLERGMQAEGRASLPIDETLEDFA
ncbi:MAG: segregation and condensation protein A [Candidatus Limnocylindrales bacterium]